MFNRVHSLGLRSAALAALMSLIPLPMLRVPVVPVSDGRKRGKPSAKPPRTGKLYPFSSKRQHARIARQLAAGQLDFSASAF